MTLFAVSWPDVKIFGAASLFVASVSSVVVVVSIAAESTAFNTAFCCRGIPDANLNNTRPRAEYLPDTHVKYKRRRAVFGTFVCPNVCVTDGPIVTFPFFACSHFQSTPAKCVRTNQGLRPHPREILNCCPMCGAAEA